MWCSSVFTADEMERLNQTRRSRQEPMSEQERAWWQRRSDGAV